MVILKGCLDLRTRRIFISIPPDCGPTTDDGRATSAPRRTSAYHAGATRACCEPFHSGRMQMSNNSGTMAISPAREGSRVLDDDDASTLELPPPVRIGLRGSLLIFGFWTFFGIVMAASLLLSPLRGTVAAPAAL